MANRVPTAEHDGNALFVKDGIPIKFCFHRGVTQGRGQITRDVERHGGQIVPHEHLANVLLVDEQEDLGFFRRRYYASTELYRLSIYIEPRGFVQACIRAGMYRHIGPVKQGMPGLAPGAGSGAGRERVPFTEEDRDHLAYYLATQFPTRDGRLGMRAYRALERLGETDDPPWVWARQHTAHSWREHYKMNPRVMDARIDYYLQRLKDIGHHLGHDPRRHNHWSLRQEEEEEEEWGEEQDQRGSERSERARPAVAAERLPNQAARDYLARHERDLVALDEEEDDGVQEEEDISEARPVKRHRTQSDTHHQSDLRETQVKRARVAKVSMNRQRVSDVEAGRAKASPARKEDSDSEVSQEIEGSDLFGDGAYRGESRFDMQNIDVPMLSTSRADQALEQDSPLFPTQATLIASPRLAEKEFTLAPAPTSTAAVEDTHQPTIPPSSQQTLVTTQERATVRRARVRGASAQPGPSMPKKTRTLGVAAAVDAPYRNTRARSHSVEPQPQPQPKPELGGGEKGKTKEEVLQSVEEDIQSDEGQEEEYAEEVVGPISVAARETAEDEMVVEELLETSLDGGDRASEESGRDENDRDGDQDEDEDEDEDDEEEDGDIMAGIPREQVIEIEDDPSDSDDAETHASLVRSAVQEKLDAPEGNESESAQDQDQDGGEGNSDEDDNADRIERMASRSLHAAPMPTDPRPRVTRSMAATRTQTQEVSSRQTRSRNQVRKAPRTTTFPSPGTRARAIVDRIQEEERRMPYAPPPGTRAARAIKRTGRRGLA